MKKIIASLLLSVALPALAVTKVPFHALDPKQEDLNVFTSVKPVQPAPQAPTLYPKGNDLVLKTEGPADLVTQVVPVDITSTTTVAPGSVTVTVSSTANLATPAGFATLTVAPETVNEEVISSVSWSIVDATHLTATFAKAHTQPYTIRQAGSVSWEAHRVAIRPWAAAGSDLIIQDGINLAPLLTLPNDATQANANWPKGGIVVNRYLTGGFPDAQSNLRIRNHDATARIIFLNSAASTEALAIDDSANVTTAGSLIPAGGIAYYSQGFKHGRLSSCSTAAAAGAVCTTVVTWSGSFVNTNYTVTCSLEGGITGVPVVSAVLVKNVNNISVQIAALTAAAASGIIDCIAVHD